LQSAFKQDFHASFPGTVFHDHNGPFLALGSQLPGAGDTEAGKSPLRISVDLVLRISLPLAFPEGCTRRKSNLKIQQRVT
jgi:hypothetical protein